MIEPSSSQPSGAVPRASPIEFYSVELTPLSDGGLSIGGGATICEGVDDGDFEFVNMEMARARVDTIDQALAVIRDAVITSMPQ
jgi:hypothetical protein